MAACMAFAFLFFARPAQDKSLALTFDDGPDMADQVGLSPAERSRSTPAIGITASV
jgi:hypothetical protein